jgi:hypothetical protein
MKEEFCASYYNSAQGANAYYSCHVSHNSHHHGLNPRTLNLCVSRTNLHCFLTPLHSQPSDTWTVPARTNQDEFPLVNCFPLSCSAWLQSRLYLRNPSKLCLSYQLTHSLTHTCTHTYTKAQTHSNTHTKTNLKYYVLIFHCT